MKKNRVFYSHITDDLKPVITEINKILHTERLGKAELKGLGKRGYEKYIKPTLQPYLAEYHARINKQVWDKEKKKYVSDRTAKKKAWWVYNYMTTGGFIRRNFSFGRETKDFYSDEIRGVDQHCAYNFLLGESCLHPEPLKANQLDPSKKYVKFCVYRFKFKMKEQYKDVPLFNNPLCPGVANPIIEGDFSRGIMLAEPFWELIQQFADFTAVKIVDEFYFQDLGPILRNPMKRYYNDREVLTGDEKINCKAMGCAAIGYLALNAKRADEGAKRIPLIDPPADYWVCIRCQMRTLSLIKFVIDHGGLWTHSVTDSVYWIGGPTYENIAANFPFGNAYGHWDKAFKGDAYHLKSMTSGYYGIADRDGNKLVQKFSGFGDDSIQCKAIAAYFKTRPLEEWDQMKILLGWVQNCPKIIELLVKDGQSNNSQMLSDYEVIQNSMLENPGMVPMTDIPHKGINAELIIRNSKKEVKK